MIGVRVCRLLACLSGESTCLLLQVEDEVFAKCEALVDKLLDLDEWVCLHVPEHWQAGCTHVDAPTAPHRLAWLVQQQRQCCLNCSAVCHAVWTACTRIVKAWKRKDRPSRPLVTRSDHHWTRCSVVRYEPDDIAHEPKDEDDPNDAV